MEVCLDFIMALLFVVWLDSATTLRHMEMALPTAHFQCGVRLASWQNYVVYLRPSAIGSPQQGFDQPNAQFRFTNRSPGGPSGTPGGQSIPLHRCGETRPRAVRIRLP